ncbi:MAG: hypothetical protein GC201_11385 [Alphaproteobacteria bacterium]|nr:hypothetical protein [Alphaproteobacteria bacterium]
MIRTTLFLLMGLGACLSGCASIVEESAQPLPIYTEPETAVCDVWQKGELVASTSGSVNVTYVSKSATKLKVTCRAEGYHPKTVTVISDPSHYAIQGMWAVVPGITDYVTGAFNKYPGWVTVALDPIPCPHEDRCGRKADMHDYGIFEATPSGIQFRQSPPYRQIRY